MRKYIKKFTCILLTIISSVSFTFSQVQVGQDIHPDIARTITLSEDGNRLAFGFTNPQGHAVTVYDLVDGNWVQIGASIESDEFSFGSAISFSDDGNILAIGTPKYSYFEDGLVQVYRLVDGDWQQMGTNIYEYAAFLGDSRWAGHSISLSSNGERIVIGAPLPSEDGTGVYGLGVARVYDFVDGDWLQIGEDMEGEAVDSWFGSSVSISADGNRIAIGSLYYGISHRGAVYVYDLIGNSWELVGEKISGSESVKRLGYSVGLSDDGNTLAIGFRHKESNEPTISGVRIYNWADDNWVQYEEELADDSEFDCGINYPAYDNFICNNLVHLNAAGNRLAYGNRWGDHFSIYDLIGEEWVEVNNSPVEWGYLRSLSMSSNGNHLAVLGDTIIRVYDLENITTSTLSVSPINNQFQLSPIPADDFIHLEFDTPQITTTIYITSVIGQIIHQETTTGTALQSKTFNIADFPKGLYFLTIDDGENIQTKRFVKQ